jgi:predicted RNA-binding protein with PIN domain
VTIVIDGYNVLKQVLHSRMITERERSRFISQLGKYAAKKSHKIVLMFDGGPDTKSTREFMHGIYVVYSGAYETADDLIRGYIETHAVEHILLITSDRELCRATKNKSVESLDARYFYDTLQENLQHVPNQGALEGHLIKTRTEKDSELDDLMTTATRVMVHKKEDSELPERRKVSQKLSKQERKFLKKVKKL